MIPSPWVGVVLALGVFRLCRLAGWDTFPLIVAARQRLVGERYVRRTSVNASMGITADAPDYVQMFRRPLLHELIVCPFCLGFWIAVAAYLAWVWFPTETLYGAFPFALSAAVGLIAKQLDP